MQKLCITKIRHRSTRVRVTIGTITSVVEFCHFNGLASGSAGANVDRNVGCSRSGYK